MEDDPEEEPWGFPRGRGHRIFPSSAFQCLFLRQRQGPGKPVRSVGAGASSKVRDPSQNLALVFHGAASAAALINGHPRKLACPLTESRASNNPHRLVTRIRPGGLGSDGRLPGPGMVDPDGFEQFLKNLEIQMTRSLDSPQAATSRFFVFGGNRQSLAASAMKCREHRRLRPAANEDWGKAVAPTDAGDGLPPSSTQGSAEKARVCPCRTSRNRLPWLIDSLLRDPGVSDRCSGHRGGLYFLWVGAV
ncbi:hypothetical protein ABIB51_002488 [Arthrobacter sp. UYCu712]